MLDEFFTFVRLTREVSQKVQPWMLDKVKYFSKQLFTHDCLLRKNSMQMNHKRLHFLEILAHFYLLYSLKA